MLHSRRTTPGIDMLTATTVVNRRDLDFLLQDWLGLDDLLSRSRFAGHDMATIAATLDLAQEIAEHEIAPHLRASDTNEPVLDPDGRVIVHPEVKRAVRLMAESGLFGAVFDAELGGMQLPNLVHFAAMGLLMSGGLPTASFMLLTVANARLIATYGNAAQIDTFARSSIAGETMGTMCMSEPDAGSSLGDISTRAIAEAEDELGRRFRLRGAKMWISAADHDITENIVHLVLAKTPDIEGRLPEGTRGISLFIVPSVLPNGERNDVTIAGLNHKLGYRGIPNCAVNFGEGAQQPLGGSGAVGWLVGDIGQGLPQMFQMMNEARISVGLGAAMLAYRGYLLSLLYATERKQGRLPGVRGGPPVAIIEHADVQRMLLAQKAYAEGSLALVLYSTRLLDDEQTGVDERARKSAADLLALLTPVTKSWPSEMAQSSLDLAIQIHGGAGYTRDFLVEQLYRDNRLNPIHEGTTGIQAIDLVGRKIRRDGGVAFRQLLEKVRSTIRDARALAALDADARGIDLAWNSLTRAVDLLTSADEEQALANAVPFLFAFGHAVVGWLWLDMAVLSARLLAGTVAEAEQSFLEGKLRTCRYFIVYEVPRVDAWLAPIFVESGVARVTLRQLFAD
jgi:alkylation response protein AidB-like acyl-CoA dehydrogenase